ncbi:uncharacterized protein LOC111597626 isoform X2 [Drosophila hydei]|nr:uncharacterized protein LOC111597626 isoform X2 [Drosophila hydei]
MPLVTYDVVIPHPDKTSLIAGATCFSILLLALLSINIYRRSHVKISLPEKCLEQDPDVADLENKDSLADANSSEWISDSTISESIENNLQPKEVQLDVKLEMETETETEKTGGIINNCNSYIKEIKQLPNQDIGDRSNLMNVKIVIGKPPIYPRRSHTNK